MRHTISAGVAELADERPWRARREDWLAVLLLLSTGLASMLSRGPLGRACAETADKGLRLEYSAVDQRAVPGMLVVRVAPGHARDGRLRLRFNDGYLRSMRIAAVTPEPESVENGRDGPVFVFRVDPPDRPATLRFWVEGLELGRIEGRLELIGGPDVGFTQFLFP